ncbi:uncharacterized protein [Amphiura filiformis]|uniref:uncharacterized protein n=1 Tax=Amphiura filiformis TaxID=82378 RepID=UPI003B2161FF
MSHRGRNSGPMKVQKDLKTHLLQSLQNNTMIGGNSGKYPADVQYQVDTVEDEDPHFLNSAYPSTLSPDIKDLQLKMTSGCQEIPPSQSHADTEGNTAAAQYPALSHQQLVESLDRLSSPPPSQLTHMWVRDNEEAQGMGGDAEGQMHYGDYNSGTQCEEDAAWDDRLQREDQEMKHHQHLDESQQPVTDILVEIEQSLHEHIDDELNSLRANLHDLVADQQVHLRRYLTPTHYSQDIDDIDIISNQDDFNGPQATLNLEDTGWSSDCMQSSCSTVNEPMKLEEASPDSGVALQDDAMTCQKESVAIINRLTEDSEIQTALIELQTTAAILSHTLRRQEYSTT